MRCQQLVCSSNISANSVVWKSFIFGKSVIKILFIKSNMSDVNSLLRRIFLSIFFSLKKKGFIQLQCTSNRRFISVILTYCSLCSLLCDLMIRSRGGIIFQIISKIKCHPFLALHFGVVSSFKSVVLLIGVEVMKLVSLTCKI